VRLYQSISTTFTTRLLGLNRHYLILLMRTRHCSIMTVSIREEFRSELEYQKNLNQLSPENGINFILLVSHLRIKISFFIIGNFEQQFRPRARDYSSSDLNSLQNHFGVNLSIYDSPTNIEFSKVQIRALTANFFSSRHLQTNKQRCRKSNISLMRSYARLF